MSVDSDTVLTELQEHIASAFFKTCKNFDLDPESEPGLVDLRDVAVELMIMEFESPEQMLIQTISDGLSFTLETDFSFTPERVRDFAKRFAVAAKRSVKKNAGGFLAARDLHREEDEHPSQVEGGEQESDELRWKTSKLDRDPQDDPVLEKQESQPGTAAAVPRVAKWQPRKIDAGVADSDGFLCDTSDELLLLHMGSHKPILKNARLTLRRGVSYALVGDNGAGKSSLLKMITQAAGVASGDREKNFDKRGSTSDVLPLLSKFFAKGSSGVTIVEVPEVPAVGAVGTVRDYFSEAVVQHPSSSGALSAEAILGRVGFGSERNISGRSTVVPVTKKVSELSGGWRMRLALAIGLADVLARPADEEDHAAVRPARPGKDDLFLLLDEPTNHLDRSAVVWLQEFLNGLGAASTSKGSRYRSITKLIVSHDYRFLDEVCGELIEVKDGRLHYFRGVGDYVEKTGKEIGVVDDDEETTGVVDDDEETTLVSLPVCGSSSGRPEENIDCSGGDHVPAPSVLHELREEQLDEQEAFPSEKLSKAVKTGVEVDRESDCWSKYQTDLSLTEKPLLFPAPDPPETGWKKTSCVLEMKNVSWTYESTEELSSTEAPPAVLQSIDLRLTLESKVGLIGANGSGKSTLMKLLSRDLDLVKQEEGGTALKKAGSRPAKKQAFLKRHRNLRIAYVPQESGVFGDEFENATALSYIRRRYINGYDQEIQDRIRNDLEERDRKAREQKLERAKSGAKKDPKARKTLLELAITHGPLVDATRFNAAPLGCRYAVTK